MEIQLDDDRTWVVTEALRKLVSRAELPGAYCYDRLAEKVHSLSQSGITAYNLLPLCLPGSWLVNGKAPSPVFKTWLSEEMRPHWEVLFELLSGSPTAVLQRSPAEKARLQAAFDALGDGRCHLSAVSKVLALLFPEVVPLLEDGAVWLLTRGVERPEVEDNGMAPPAQFVPCVEAFCRAMQQVAPSCEALSHHYGVTQLTSGQVLDRLLWFDAWGHRHFGYRGEESLGRYVTLPAPGAAPPR